MNSVLDEIPLAYISVNSRVQTEIYAQGVYEDDSYKNVIAGTVLEEQGNFP